MKSDAMVMLNEFTGIAHKYKGVGLGKPLSCGCDGIEEAMENDMLTILEMKHVEEGIWKKAPCLEEEKWER
jgi:hypothetical protein